MFRISSLDKVFSGCFRHAFFRMGDIKVVAGSVRQVVILDEWLPYRDGHLNRFDCNSLS